ncbi:hypothetical protein Xcel_2570 [Xylanimonas cellulosilytica DSM 15894]|uniref:Uncharacterized protein n=1 Tax=Xylanimonas cellulosilytica (strain DSM 15894 / JCM 12276 / CECT 5975 / KCTC 9989 / LMG 20990 / NBRC 107835 / XIL07) TaxID=446471 RepID=D1BX17_XYLCX|nr:DUF6541 family protein [Xylanimonas cellulosilytica]ACZ31585.1 hypothetical protein Xcel_2570 [Xylanimonas cellulosilytica DSM 15894]
MTTLADWAPVAPVVLLSVVALFAPGLALTSIVLRFSLRSLAAAPAVTIGLVGVGGVVLGAVGVRWSWWTFAAFVAVVALVAWGCRRLLRSDRLGTVTSPRRWAWVAVGGATGATLVAGHVIRMIGVPDAISQTWDVQFHLNAIRHVLSSGNASSLGLQEVFGNTFYPLGYHSVGALIAEVSGAGIPQTVSALNLVVAAVVWPLGCIALASVLAPRQHWTAVLAGIMSAGFGAFPYLLLVEGVVYAQFLSFALLPGLFALVIWSLRLDDGADGDGRLASGGPDDAPLVRGAAPGLPLARPALCALLILVASAGLAFAQPSGLLVAMALSTPPVVTAAAAHVRRLASSPPGIDVRRRVVATLVVTGATLMLMAVVWRAARPAPLARRWPPEQTLGEAVRSGLTASTSGGYVEIVAIALAALGLGVVLVQYRRWWIGVSALIPVLLYVSAAGMPEQWRLRRLLTDAFFHDSHRLAALIPIGAIMLAVVGAGFAGRAGERLVRRVEDRTGPNRPIAALRTAGTPALLLVVLVTLGVSNPGVDVVVADGRRVYTESTRFLSPPERALIEDLPTLTPEGALIAVNPAMGGAFTWALADRPVTAPYFDTPTTPELALINAHLDEIATMPEVCEAVLTIELQYVLDFGPTAGTWFDEALWAGFDQLAPGEHLELVAETDPEARLFRIVC